jgi:hypothetical protein
MNNPKHRLVVLGPSIIAFALIFGCSRTDERADLCRRDSRFAVADAVLEVHPLYEPGGSSWVSQKCEVIHVIKNSTQKTIKGRIEILFPSEERAIEGGSAIVFLELGGREKKSWIRISGDSDKPTGKP